MDYFECSAENRCREKDNLGFRILMRQGWTEGLGLGRRLQGCVDAVPVEYKHEQLGLGRLQMEMDKIGASGKHRRLLECEKALQEEPPSPNISKENQEDGVVQHQKTAFHCSQCNKMYKCYVQWDNHLNSYDHAHKQRLHELQRKEVKRKLGFKKSKSQNKKRGHCNKSPSRVPLTTKSFNTVQPDNKAKSLEHVQPGVANKVKFCLKTYCHSRDVHRAFRQQKDANGPSVLAKPTSHCPYSHCLYYRTKPVWGSARCALPFLTFVKASDQTPCDNGNGQENSNVENQSEGSEENGIGDADGTNNEGENATEGNEENAGKDKDEGKDGEKPPKENGGNGNNNDKSDAEETPIEELNNEDNPKNNEDKNEMDNRGDNVEVDVPLDQIALPPPIKLQDIKIPEGKIKLLTFIKVLGRDEVTELEWPAEMIQYTVAEPKLTYSCNPLYFDLGALCGRPSKSVVESDSKSVLEMEIVSNVNEPTGEFTGSLVIQKCESLKSEVLPQDKATLAKLDAESISHIINKGEEVEVKPKKKKKHHHKKHKKKKGSHKGDGEAKSEHSTKKNKKKKKHKHDKSKKAKQHVADGEKGEEKDTEEGVEADSESDIKLKEKPKKKSKHKKKKRKHRKAKKRKHEGADGEKRAKSRSKKVKKEETKEEIVAQVSPPEAESESQNGDDFKRIFKMKFKSTLIKAGLTKPEALEEDEASVDLPKHVSKMTPLATRIEENKKSKEVKEENSSQRSTGSRKRTISETSQNGNKQSKKMKKSSGKKKKIKTTAKNSEKTSEVPVDKDFNGDDGTNVPKWDTSDSELESSTTTGFGKITQLDMQQAGNIGVKSDVSITGKVDVPMKTGDLSDPLTKPVTSDRHRSRSSRSYSRSRWGRSHSSGSDQSRYSCHSSYSSYSRSRSRSYSRSYTRSRSYSSYSDYSSRSRSYSYSSRSRSHSYRSRSYSRGRRRRHSRSYSRGSYSGSSYSCSRSRSSSYSRSRSRCRSRSLDLLKESPDKEYSSLLPKRDPKPVKKSDKDREQRTFEPKDLMVAVPINTNEVSDTAQDLLKKVKERENDGDSKVLSVITKIQSSGGKAVVPLIDRMPSARRKDEMAELIPLPSGKQPGKGPHFIGPTLPPDHPLAHLQDIPVPPSKSKSSKTDLSKVPLPPPITMANAKNMKFLSRVPPPPPPPVASNKDGNGSDGKISPNKEDDDAQEDIAKEKAEGIPPAVVIPPEQAQMYIALQKQARKHARNMKREDGEDVESSSESEPEPMPEPEEADPKKKKVPTATLR